MTEKKKVDKLVARMVLALVHYSVVKTVLLLVVTRVATKAMKLVVGLDDN
jgi:molybdopterin-binding protein